jgi:hypothetical protein
MTTGVDVELFEAGVIEEKFTLTTFPDAGE